LKEDYLFINDKMIIFLYL